MDSWRNTLIGSVVILGVFAGLLAVFSGPILETLTAGHIQAGTSVAATVNVAEDAADAQVGYDEARWDPLHFKPAIDSATDEQCLACHSEILERQPLAKSPAGVQSATALAWYQTLDTYSGAQDTFHRRHLVSEYATQVMDLRCNFCHQGNDPREEVPGNGTQADGTFTLRKMVSPADTCLMCHGVFPLEVMVGLAEPWPVSRLDLEDPETPNGCLGCHADLYRTVRHQVSYLKADAIEELAQAGSDVCYGCHGGRQWYRINFPYPRHPWPGMEDIVDGTPEWAVGRPTESDPRYRLNAKK